MDTILTGLLWAIAVVAWAYLILRIANFFAARRIDRRARNASAPRGLECADCAIDGRACSDCYRAYVAGGA